MAIPQSQTTFSQPLNGLARTLVRQQLLSEQAAFEANENARSEGTPLTTYLVEKGLLDAASIARTASRDFSIPLFDLSALEHDTSLTDIVDDKIVQDNRALPIFRRGNHLYVALSDPTNQKGLEEIKFASGLRTEPILVADDQLGLVIEQVLSKVDALGGMLDEDLDNIEVSAEEDTAADRGAEASDADDTPVVRFVNSVLLDAINKGASDIHFEPYEKFFRVRFRQDGILHEIARPPNNLATRMIARLKVMSNMDIAERRVPQDGRVKMNLSKKRHIDFRVNSLPTLYGEKVVLRILDPSSAMLGIDALGYEDDQKALFLKAMHRPQGMVLVTGPTGSGKTVSLYTALNILNTNERNISTAEDPVEIQLAGINQVNVNEKTGMTFAAALRAFLRQDPDIVMVGEIRDLETAEIAIKAAQTGHMVLSTLHTNDAPQTLNRLANMGVPPYNIASAVILIIAQRLARRLCENCKEPIEVPPEALQAEGFTDAQIADGITVYKPVGCDKCTGGYKGRVGVYEVMPISEDIGRLIMSGGNAIELADQAQREGVNNLRQSGLRKVLQGTTSLEEVNRVTKD
jgi:type IV pilus assembly protein PilB